MHISRTPSPPFPLPSEELIPLSAPRLVALTTKYYTPKSRRELRGWREDSEFRTADLRIASQRPFEVKSKAQWTKQPRYPRDLQAPSPPLPKIAHKKSASELLRMPLTPSLGDLYLTELCETPKNNPKPSYLPFIRRLDNRDSHHTHTSPGIPNLHLATDPNNALKLKSKPRIPHLMPSTLLKPAPHAIEAVVDREIRFKSHETVSIGVEVDGSPYQERVVLERVNRLICRPQMYLKQREELDIEGSAWSDGDEEYEGFIVTLGEDKTDRESNLSYSQESYAADEEKEAISDLQFDSEIGETRAKAAFPKAKHHKTVSTSTVETQPLVTPLEEAQQLEEDLSESQASVAMMQEAALCPSKPQTPDSLDQLDPARSPTPQCITPSSDLDRESQTSQRETMEREALEGMSTSSNLQDQKKEMALMQCDEQMLTKELNLVKGLRRAEAIKRKSLLLDEEKARETALKLQIESAPEPISVPISGQFKAPSITIELSRASPGTPPPSPPSPTASMTSSLSPPDPALTAQIDRRASIHEYYPEAIEEEIREDQSDFSFASSRKSSHTKGVPTPFATSRRTSFESEKIPVLSRKSTLKGKYMKPRRSLTEDGGLQRAGSSFALKTDEEGTNLSSEVPEEEEKIQTPASKAHVESAKPAKPGKSAIKTKPATRRNSKVRIPKRKPTKINASKTTLPVDPFSGESSPRIESSTPTPKAGKTKISGFASAISQSSRLTPAVELVKAPRRVSFGSIKKKSKDEVRRNSDVFTFEEDNYMSADEVFVRQFSFALMKVIIGLDKHILSELDRVAVSVVKEKVLGIGYSQHFPQGNKGGKALIPAFESDPSLQSTLGAVILKAPLFKTRSSVSNPSLTPSKSQKTPSKPPFKPKLALDQSIGESDMSDPTPHPSGLDHARANSLFELKHLSLLQNIASNLRNTAVPEQQPVPDNPKSESESEEEVEKPPLPVDLWFVGHSEDLEDDVPASLEALFKTVRPIEMNAFTTNVTNFFKDAESAKTIDVMLASEKQEMDEANYRESVERRKFQEYVKTLPEYWELKGKEKAELRQVEHERFVPSEQNAYFRHGFMKRKRRNQVVTSRQGSQPALLYAKPTYTFTGLSSRYYTACTSPQSIQRERIGDVVLSGGAHLVKEENSYRERIYCRIKQEKNLDQFALKGKHRRAAQGSISSVKSA